MNQTLLSSFGTAFERVEHALSALREGRGVMVLDDEDRGRDHDRRTDGADHPSR